MPLVPAICTQCGAQIEVDNKHEAGICKHCGTAFITEKAINNYNTHITNHIHTDKVVIGTNFVDGLVNDAYKCLDRGAYDVVLTLYRKIQKEYPADYRGYWLECIYETHNFNPQIIKAQTRIVSFDAGEHYSYVPTLNPDPHMASVAFRTAYNLAPDTEKNSMLQKYREYIRLYNIQADEYTKKEYEIYRQKKEEDEKKANEYKKTRFKNEVTKPVVAILIFLVVITIGYFSLSNVAKGLLLFPYVLLVIACPVWIYSIVHK